MKRMILLCGVCGLAALAIFVSLMRPNGARIDAAEIQIAVGNAVPEPDGGSHAQELQLPDPMPSSVAGRNGDQRRPVESPELRLRKSFEARYEGFTFQDLVAEPARARERLAAAQSARFDELHSSFELELASGRHGARVCVGGVPNWRRAVHPGCVHPESGRTVRQANGSLETHMLEICPSTDPATRDLLEEIAWLEREIPRRPAPDRKSMSWMHSGQFRAESEPPSGTSK